MDVVGLEALLQAAQAACETAQCPLSDRQSQVLGQVLQDFCPELSQVTPNPLDQLTATERQIFLDFVQQQRQQNRAWKTTLLDDWLQGNDSGAVQVIRDRYGMAWLDQVQPSHLATYLNAAADPRSRLQVGDRIEVTNALWEWVQEDGPCGREWFPCIVVGLTEEAMPADCPEPIANIGCTCTVRFDTGNEYEIPAVYDWNRANWRWPE
jgi:hypothetical protein